MIADAVVWSYVKDRPPSEEEWSDVSIALWNSGGIRVDFNQGNIMFNVIKIM